MSPAPARGVARGRPLSTASPASSPAPAAFRCALAGEQRGESLAGTASTYRAFLLLEHAGSWGHSALRDARLPEGLGGTLARAGAAAGVKVLLMRRPGRSAPEGRRVFAVYAGPGARTWTTVLDRPEDVLDLDLAALRAGRSPAAAQDLVPHEEPVFGVCTHGRHDACCAERGRPVAAALAAHHPEQTWELSHLGGDRFAASLLIAPDGLYYGRLDPDAALAVAAARLRGEVELDHLRGRSWLPTPVQYAEIALRRELGLVRLGALRLLRRTAAGGVTTAVFEAGGATYTVVVATTRGEPVLLTCHAGRAQPPPVHRLVSLSETDEAPAAG